MRQSNDMCECGHVYDRHINSETGIKVERSCWDCPCSRFTAAPLEPQAALKPCPFCGSKAEFDYPHPQNGTVGVICSQWISGKCKITVRVPYSESKEEVVAIWNTRTPDGNVEAIDEQKKT